MNKWICDKYLCLFASRAHIQQSPTCTRVQITLVYIRYVSNTNSLSVLLKSALWKRFSQRVYSVQIRMYFANPSMTILDVVPRHMETSENMLGCRMSPWFPCISSLGIHQVQSRTSSANTLHLTLRKRQYTLTPS